MIDEKKTHEKFGYYSSDLSTKSGKKIVCICNECGKERIIFKHGYRDLCISCSRSGKNHPMHGKHHSTDSREKMSKSKMGANNPMFGKRGYWFGITDENSPHYIDGKWIERSDAKRRGFPKLEHFLGNKYNDKYKMVSHHFNEKIIIYIPERLHQKYRHNLKTGKGMLKINKLAFKFLLKGTIS